MTEADFQTKFTRWAKYNLPSSTACELKLTKGLSVPFDAVVPHQVNNLKLVKHGGFGYKISDSAFGQKPFDFFTLKGDAFVVIMFYKRGQKEFFMIDIDAWLLEINDSKRKSLTEERARVIGTAYFLG